MKYIELTVNEYGQKNIFFISHIEFMGANKSADDAKYPPDLYRSILSLNSKIQYVIEKIEMIVEKMQNAKEL